MLVVHPMGARMCRGQTGSHRHAASGRQAGRAGVEVDIRWERRRAPVAGRGVDGEGDDERGRVGGQADKAGVRLVKAAQHQVRVDGRLRRAAARSALQRRHQGHKRRACMRV
jgi:hypothetical protein